MTDDLLKLARFRILDSRNCDEEAKDRLLGQMADEIERLRKYAQHLPTCPTVASTDGPNAPYPCRCGLESP
jgi:hypothetical protein